MEFEDTAVVMSGVFIGLVGLALFIYGKKTMHLPTLAAGAAMGVLPLFSHSLLTLWCVAAGCAACVYASRRSGG